MLLWCYFIFWLIFVFFLKDNETSETESRLNIDQVSERGWSETLNSISKADSSPDEVSEIVEEIETKPKSSVMSLSGRSHTQK